MGDTNFAWVKWGDMMVTMGNNPFSSLALFGLAHCPDLPPPSPRKDGAPDEALTTARNANEMSRALLSRIQRLEARSDAVVGGPY